MLTSMDLRATAKPERLRKYPTKASTDFDTDPCSCAVFISVVEIVSNMMETNKTIQHLLLEAPMYSLKLENMDPKPLPPPPRILQSTDFSTELNFIFRSRACTLAGRCPLFQRRLDLSFACLRRNVVLTNGFKIDFSRQTKNKDSATNVEGGIDDVDDKKIGWWGHW
mmetsp:Transcript_7987/g.14774  ORF Transcript_7987/g.14774 Transcript_7987/m.14774 type:complete len:167 (+) Transcript_7987:329-829(+)